MVDSVLRTNAVTTGSCVNQTIQMQVVCRVNMSRNVAKNARHVRPPEKHGQYRAISMMLTPGDQMAKHTQNGTAQQIEN
jgi:hypothetical protein